MILSAARNVIVFHVPKTGGTSVKGALAPCFRGKEATLALRSDFVLHRTAAGRIDWRPRAAAAAAHAASGPWPKRRRFLTRVAREAGAVELLHKHSDVAEAQGFLTPGFYAAARKILFVRHPYARTYSAYRYKVQTATPKDRLWARLFPGGRAVSFDDFLAAGLHDGLMAARPQHLWYDPGDAAFLVCRSDEIDALLPGAVADVLGLSRRQRREVAARLAAGRRNVSAAPDDWRGISAEARRRIDAAYAADFDAFGF